MRAPAACALQSAELAGQVEQAPLPAAVLYSLMPHELHVAPPSGLVYPALQVPGELVEELLHPFASQAVQATLPADAL